MPKRSTSGTPESPLERSRTCENMKSSCQTSLRQGQASIRMVKAHLCVVRSKTPCASKQQQPFLALPHPRTESKLSEPCPMIMSHLNLAATPTPQPHAAWRAGTGQLCDEGSGSLNTGRLPFHVFSDRPFVLPTPKG